MDLISKRIRKGPAKAVFISDMKTLKEIYLECEDGNYIESSLYSAYRVKQGLRNDNGTGVKVGLTRICDVIGYRMVKNHKKPIDGQLIYRGYQISDLVRLAKQDEAIHGYEITAFTDFRKTSKKMNSNPFSLRSNMHSMSICSGRNIRPPICSMPFRLKS